MITYKDNTLQHIARIKSGAFGGMDISSRGIHLRPLTHEVIRDMHILRLLARWRKKHEFWFPAQFPVTLQRTAIWLQKRVLDEPDRLLFLIDVHGTYRGHVGLYRFDFDNKSCEIDNIVRGRAGRKGMMGEAIVLMMRWGMETLGLSFYTLQTTSDNVRALALYTRLGFVETKRIPLIYTKTSDGGEWLAAPNGYAKRIKRFDVYMTWKGTL